MGEWWIAGLLVLAEVSFQLAFAAHVFLRGPSRQASRVSWVLVVLMVPVLGVLLYLLVGRVQLGARRMRRHAEIVERIRGQITADWDSGRYPQLPSQYGSIATLAETVGGTAVRGDNELKLMGDTDEVIDRLVQDLDEAQDHCHLLFYIYLDDPSGCKVAEALMRAAGRGVACRLLVDAVGSHDFLESKLRVKLESAGVSVVGALPANLLRAAFARMDLRNHRKLAVIDGVVGFTGSQNVADAAFAPKPRFAPWVDAMLRLRGPAVRDLQELFVCDWYLDTEESLEHVLLIEPPEIPGGVPVQVMGTGPSSYNKALLQLNQATFHLAREEVILTTPYFVPDETTAAALETAALRGIRVHVVVPARNDSPLVACASRSYYAGLLEAGVQIHEYQKGLLHAKTLTLDRDLALVSTANFDRRSFDLNFEVSTVIYDSDFASQLRFLQRSYMADSTMIDRTTWLERPWHKRLVENALGTFSPLL